ncbi:MAG: hypothetical protein WBP16_17095 [Ferruginibacter sp.]
MSIYSYDVGKDSSRIALMADIDTIGLAASRATVLDLSSTDPSESVAHSVDATGDIAEQEIGTGKTLKKKQLTILTKIDLIGDKEAKKKESERISAKYYLDGGKDGYLYFDDPIKVVADDFSTVFLLMEIDLTA